MSDHMGEERLIGYCTNVHAGTDLKQTKDNLVIIQLLWIILKGYLNTDFYTM